MKRTMKRDSGAAVVYLLASVTAFWITLGAACVSSNRLKLSPDVMVPPVADAAPERDAAPSDDCEADCRLWRAQGCSEGNPTATGMTCEQVCRNALDNGIDTAHQLSCAETASSCAVHRACPY